MSIEKSNRMRVGAERETFTTMVAYKGGKEERQAVKNKEVASKNVLGPGRQINIYLREPTTFSPFSLQTFSG